MSEHRETRRIAFSQSELLRDSHFDGSYEEWEEQRRFISDAIDRDGTLLDIGSANGYLLKCLQEWSGHDLIPYGIDTDEKAIEKARQLFPGQEDQFAVLGKEGEPELPEKFDLIFWNVWDDIDFDDEEAKRILDMSVERSVDDGGRLILGFYHPEEFENLRKMKQLTELGFEVQEVPGPKDRPEHVVYIEKSV